jgi:hypothetical protein
MNSVTYSETFASHAKRYVNDHFALTPEKIKETNDLFELIHNM